MTVAREKAPGTRRRKGRKSEAGVEVSTQLKLRWVALLLLVAVLVAYFPAMMAGFIWDDDDYVTANQTLRTLSGLGDIWFKLGATPQYYPLVHTTYWIEYRMWSLNATGYHVVNVLLHAGNSLLVFLVLSQLGVRGALFGAALFALHPLHVESVAWITERKNTLSCLFYLSSALMYIRYAGTGESSAVGSQRLYIGSLACYVLALLSKTVTATLPAALLVILWWKRSRIVKRDVVRLLPFFAVGFSLSFVTVWMEKHNVGADFDLSPVERVLIAGRAVWFYAVKLLAPVKLIFIYPRWEIDARAAWQYLFPIAAVAAVIALAVSIRRMGRGPLAAVLIFGGTLVPALGFFDVYPMQYSFVADHFQYHASIAMLALFAAAAVAIADHFGWSIKSRYVASGAVAVALGALTFAQTRIYRDLETLWRDTLEKNPKAYIAHINLANVLADTDRIPEAMRHYDEALHLRPDDDYTHYNVGTTMLKTGNIGLAIQHLQKVTQLTPENGMAYFNLGIAHERLGDLDKAEEHFRIATKKNPKFAEAYVNLANIEGARGQVQEAIRNYRHALSLNGSIAAAHYNLALILQETNDRAGARKHFEEALRLNPNDAEAAGRLRALGER